jgi:hypothetical protein
MHPDKAFYCLRHRSTGHIVGKEERPHHPRLTGTRFAKLATLQGLIERAAKTAHLYGWDMGDYDIVRFVMREDSVTHA